MVLKIDFVNQRKKLKIGGQERINGVLSTVICICPLPFICQVLTHKTTVTRTDRVLSPYNIHRALDARLVLFKCFALDVKLCLAHHK